MNTHVTTGAIAFIIWSTFSTWYYVNYVKDFDPIITDTEEPIANNQLEEEIEPEVIEPTPVSPINISRDFLFALNSTQLISPEKVNRFLDSIQTDIGDRSVNWLIEGHTCNLGTEKYNQQLGKERASAVKTQLLKRIPESSIETISKGESAPKYPNTTDANRKKNRRVAITIKSKS